MCPDPHAPPTGPKEHRGLRLALTWSLLVAVLCGGLGFAYKIVQFSRESQGIDGATFMVPVMVYLVMAMGFLSLLLWAAGRGMFHDIEQPKRALLEREEEYERQGI